MASAKFLKSALTFFLLSIFCSVSPFGASVFRVGVVQFPFVVLYCRQTWVLAFNKQCVKEFRI
jgi:hypothetical protein